MTEEKIDLIKEAAITHTKALQKALFIKDSYEQHDFLSGNFEGFKAGAEWQKEQDKELIEALKNIAAWPGNLPDERYISRTGANDAALRGGMVVAMRQIALSALKKI